MNIGIDIDDTISNSFEIIFADSQKFDIEKLGNDGEVKQYGLVKDHNYIETIYQKWTKEQADEFWETYFHKYMTEAVPKTYVAETFKKLKEEGNNIYLITSRYEFEEKSNEVENTTKEWLAKNGICYDELVMNVQDKLIASKEKNIDLFIDDSISHCKRVQGGNIKTFLYTSICNQGVEAEDLERVYSWPQIYNKIQNIKKDNK